MGREYLNVWVSGRGCLCGSLVHTWNDSLKYHTYKHYLMTNTPISLDDLSPAQLSQLKQKVADQQKANADSIVASILAQLSSSAEVVTSQSGNKQIRHQLNVTNADGFRIFGGVYIHNKKNPDKLQSLVQ